MSDAPLYQTTGPRTLDQRTVLELCEDAAKTLQEHLKLGTKIGELFYNLSDLYYGAVLQAAGDVKALEKYDLPGLTLQTLATLAAVKNEETQEAPPAE